MGTWTLDDIPWDRFDRDKVDPELLRIVKAASLVEQNGGDYAHYLCNVFHDDPDFQAVALAWGREEIQHGEALGRWAMLADPAFDHAEACRRFTAGFRVDLDAKASVRGTRSGELIARCIVETGTSSYYTALAEAAEEPVLQAICRRIAADEHRHYKLFYDHLKRLSRPGADRLLAPPQGGRRPRRRVRGRRARLRLITPPTRAPRPTTASGSAAPTPAAPTVSIGSITWSAAWRWC